jgi:xanthine phosphoribosyltransferase
VKRGTDFPIEGSMEILKQRILSDGVELGTEILKVDSFLNHQIDIELIRQIGQEFARRFQKENITKILTIESSGIAVACATSFCLGDVPVIFAKKEKASSMTDEYYCAQVKSFTKGTISMVRVNKKFLHSEDTILIIDDFLAHGEAASGLINIVKQAGARLAGVAIVIEKEFQGGGEKIKEQGIRLESLAVVCSMQEGKIRFR